MNSIPQQAVATCSFQWFLSLKYLLKAGQKKASRDNNAVLLECWRFTGFSFSGLSLDQLKRFSRWTADLEMLP